MAVALTRAGYGTFDEVMQWTPFRMSQVLWFDARQARDEQKAELVLQAMAARGEPAELRKMLTSRREG